MAPPSTRRPGFSRRAQYGLFIGYIVAVGGVLLAVLLLIIAAVDPRGFAALRGAALDVTAPITGAGRSVVRFFGNAGDEIGAYFNAASQNRAMRAELEASRQKLIEARAINFENRRLKALLKVSQATGDRVATARIVGSSFDSSRRLATLSAGSASGIQIGQPVRGPEGLIGRVIETGRHAARVLLITDGSSNVPVQLTRSGIPAIATGKGDGFIEIKPLEVGENPFRKGDILVTSGTGGIFPPNIPVAQVTRADRDATIARPLADPARIDFAIVQHIYQPAANLPLNEAEPPPGSEAAQ
ncbi:rod shape-determining protein MreC [Allosphingosinicella flava]|uniref:Cell shape-determining protein MreC n=1 Tax=Allosphingosinicella flava TaxID=2771430 RepID=A0A7T2GKB2_9SPHN|nr:rod shape-determining protein MreC [Sphingosinicella flava]QPQ55439.1 rod shape-determining protein MreC [Sphingosinicella flava]